ncbi:MAG: hypothetical protein PHC62_06880 [Candidatus Izemoplasmatales bacterium]|nr:hypothetical protein [Candidatus Izemoplasmatales bacterium]
MEQKEKVYFVVVDMKNNTTHHITMTVYTEEEVHQTIKDIYGDKIKRYFYAPQNDIVCIKFV